MLIQDKLELKFIRIKQQFGCGYYSVCCRENCPCELKYTDYDKATMQAIKQEFDQQTQELFGGKEYCNEQTNRCRSISNEGDMGVG